MRRRGLLAGSAALAAAAGVPPGVAWGNPSGLEHAAGGEPRSARPERSARVTSRVRFGHPDWPGAAEWDRLRDAVGGRLLAPVPALAACRGSAAACDALFHRLKNPYAIGDDPALTQTCGWVDAWTSQPSRWVVAAESAQDVASAVRFARAHRLRLVVRGGGHSYLGTSNAPDSLMIWTRRMRAIRLHDDFVPAECAPAGPAVSLGAGCIWLHAYDAVTTGGGRLVQGGGCLTVGCAGLVQGGGFGSYSKAFGTAACNLLEAEIVTADGQVRIANAATNPDLFWALKGAGGGVLGVVTRMTLQTHDLPATVGVVWMEIKADSTDAFHRLAARFLAFVAANLVNRHWGEVATLRPDNRLVVRMEFQDLDAAAAEAVWQPFVEAVAANPAWSFLHQPVVRAIAGRHRWDAAFLRKAAPDVVRFDDRPGAPDGNMFWSGNVAEAGHVIYGFESAWLPADLLRADRRAAFADTLADAARLWPVELHFQKGLSGASETTRARVADTPMNPAVLDAFALAIIAGEAPPAFPGLDGHEPDRAASVRDAARIAAAMAVLRQAVPDSGAYVAESSFFQVDWQRAYWGGNYPKLRAIKDWYDPESLFYAHNGVGSEDWTDDGFNRVSPG